MTSSFQFLRPPTCICICKVANKRNLCVFVCVYVCVYTYTHTHIHTYVHKHTHIYIYIYIYNACVSFCVCVCACIGVHIYIYIYIYILDCPVGWGCRIHWLHLCRGVRPPFNECPGFDPKQSDGEVPVTQGLWRIRSTPSLSLLWPSVVTPNWALCEA